MCISSDHGLWLVNAFAFLGLGVEVFKVFKVFMGRERLTCGNHLMLLLFILGACFQRVKCTILVIDLLAVCFIFISIFLQVPYGN